MAINISQIRLSRGAQSAVNSASLLLGEPAVAIDTREIFVGDGTGKIKISDFVVSATYATLPAGELNKVYLVKADENDSNKPNLYIYSGSAYVHVSAGSDILSGDITDLTTAINTVIDTRRGAASGVASLDASGKITSSELPPLAITSVNVVADIAARDALTVEEGDVAIVQSNETNYIYDGTGSWQELLDPGAGIASVNGDSGPNVVLDTDDITEGSTNLYFTDARAITAVILDTAVALDSTYSSTKIESSLTTHDSILGTRTITENTGAADDGKAIAFNNTSGNLEYHEIVIDGGDL